ncbi:MAG TPA: TIGR03086 family metal-binding protein [Acidimicrobiales bacterium]|nr:TIGR03086 family metal-binding protein [Acidimicrobiales bacterium]
MNEQLLDQYGRASKWTLTKIEHASTSLDAETSCDGWDVRTLLNHVLETQRYFVAAARGQDAVPPSPTPPELLSDDPFTDFEQGRAETLTTFEAPGVIEKTGPSLGIAFCEQLLHGWDLAKATGQDATMPEDLPGPAYEGIHGRFADDQRQGIFKPALTVGPDASAQDRLLAYTGRDPES